MNVFEPAPHRVEYSRDGHVWELLSDTYEHYARAATIATALQNRGFKTRITKGAR